MSRHGLPATFVLLGWQGDVTGLGPFLDLEMHVPAKNLGRWGEAFPGYAILTEALERRP